MERDSYIPADLVCSTEGQLPEFVPPINFTDLNGKTYRYGYQLETAFKAKEVTFLYYLPIPGKPNMTQEQKLLRPSYIQDVIAQQAEKRTSKSASVMVNGKEYTLAGQSHSPEDKLKQDPLLFLVREPDRLVEHDLFVRKSEL